MQFKVHLVNRQAVFVEADGFEMTRASNPDEVPGTMLIFRDGIQVLAYLPHEWNGIEKDPKPGKVTATILG